MVTIVTERGVFYMPSGIVWSPIDVEESPHNKAFGYTESKCKVSIPRNFFDLLVMDADRFYYDYNESEGTEYIKLASDGSTYATRTTTVSESNDIYTVDITTVCEDLGINWVYRWKNDVDGNWTGGRLS